MTETSKVYCREASMVPIYSLLLFGGSVSVEHEKSLLKLDDWAQFKASPQTAVLVSTFLKSRPDTKHIASLEALCNLSDGCAAASFRLSILLYITTSVASCASCEPLFRSSHEQKCPALGGRASTLSNINSL